jgi:hypothetical protein
VKRAEAMLFTSEFSGLAALRVNPLFLVSEVIL